MSNHQNAAKSNQDCHAQRRQPGTRKIRSRDDLSFTKRDAQGFILNWVVPDRQGNWHEHYGIGEHWFNEIVELAQHSPEDAFHAMRAAGPELLHFWNCGHAAGFFERMACWALAAILDGQREPRLPFDLPRFGIPPREGMDCYQAPAAPRPSLTPAELNAIDKQAWQEAVACQRSYYQRRRIDLMACQSRG